MQIVAMYTFTEKRNGMWFARDARGRFVWTSYGGYDVIVDNVRSSVVSDDR